MKIYKKRLITSILAAILVFCTATFFPCAASSDDFLEIGTQKSTSMTVSGKNYWGDISKGTKSGTIRAGYENAAGLTVTIRLYYNKGGAMTHVDRTSNSHGTSITYTPSNLSGKVSTVYGNHILSYNGAYRLYTRA